MNNVFGAIIGRKKHYKEQFKLKVKKIKLITPSCCTGAEAPKP